MRSPTPERIADPKNELVDVVWRDIEEALPRARVSQVVSEVSARFRDARITAFIPIFVRRTTRERLQEEMRRAHV